MKLEMKPVNSTNIISVGYNAEERTLVVDFHNGKRYKYHPVTEQGHRELINSDSIGKYFFKNIRGNKNITTTKM